jgi:PhzF family phenazine biosynthesis protein
MKLYWVDAFTAHVFAGNPAGVVPLESWLPDERMRQIAFENGLSETAFFVRTGPARFHLRWFTPNVEVDLCGHATLASAFVVFHELGQSGDSITFDSRSGPLHVTRLASGELELDFPSSPPTRDDSPELRAAVVAALGGAEVQWLGRSPWDLFAVLSDPAAVAALAPDFNRVHALGHRGLSVSAAGGPRGIDFVSRWFGPQSGVAEDPVTGSAHCALAPFWSERLGRNPLRARQISARGGELLCTVAGDRVRLAGRAALYLRGELSV